MRRVLALAPDDGASAERKRGSGTKFLRVWDFAAARAAELLATTSAIEERTGKKLGVQSLPRHLRRRARSFAPRVTRRRPNLKRTREGRAGDAFRRAREATRRRGALNARRRLNDDGNEVKTLRTHVWHAKRCVETRFKAMQRLDAGDDEITHPANPRTFRRSLETSVHSYRLVYRLRRWIRIAIAIET